jgi:very-short-patch-repair endonuclease
MERANKNNLWHYNQNLLPLAHNLRLAMTKAEACLWKYVLRAGMMKGYTFRRQRPVLNYIADFMCKELMVVIEVDGFSHDDEIILNKDAKRQAELEAAGFSVLRFLDSDVLKGIEGVRRTIENFADDFEKRNGSRARIVKRNKNS